MNLKEIAKDLGLEQEEYLELLDLFITTSISDLNILQFAVEAGDAGQAAQAIHSLKGAACNLRLMEIYDAAKEIEAETSNDRLQGIAEATQALKNKLDTFAKLVQNNKNSDL